MKTLLTIFLSIYLTNVFGQNSDNAKYSFPTLVFKSDLYRPVTFKKFTGEIKKESNTFYRFGDKTLKISLEDTTILEIFTTGIFNPDIVFGQQTIHKDQSELDTLSLSQRRLYNLIRNDSLSICCFEQLERLNPNVQIKRFKFWVFRIGVSNPTEYYLELQNERATSTIPLKDFLENSVMTFYHQGTVII